ncbi:response regulator [Anaplasma marginale]|uniref:histidine kinase n=3 Tax=Anaplasma marginale TaxID=770 RepID=B9KIC2_ANAMF|nr:response regulator [Anaplasma marginale]AAV86528.1 sensory box histidine kinase/response regulator [Anaplasma marginale str. St. Maries]ACM49234.1 sensory box histidine kinase/response regulator (dhkA) [Anaplasma marginale str. Florida]AGZ78781.1 histidine kinase [Anaplasma marginale str. Gypsy Plains]AXW83978.1 hybrid sensor histidine kinase/response regulator [Anaplasma marginale]AXW84895.1 hybrid sensor histidine kinase/response regulator [Anaplasma marginale]
MKKRYTDNEQNNKVDFVERDYGISKIKAATVVILPLLCVFSIYLFGIENGYVSMVFNCLFTSATVLVILQKLNRYPKIIATIEYQNMIFANALNHDTEFCLILKSNGNVVYSDARFNARFKNLGRRPLNLFSILKLGNLSEDEIARFLGALKNKSPVRTYFSVSKKNSVSNFSLILDPIADNPQVDVEQEATFRLLLNPLSRPQDYFVLKAMKITKEEVHERLLHRHKVGSYLLNQEGVIISANENFLRIFELEAIKRHTLFSDFLSKNQSDAAEDEAVFITSTGTMFKAHVTQEVFYDKSNNSYTCGLLTPKKFSLTDYQLNPCFIHAPIAMAQCDLDGKIIKYNKAFEALTDGQNHGYIFEHVTSVHNKKIKKYLQGSAINNMSIEGQLCNKTYVKIYMNKLVHNNEISVVCYITDSADRKSLETQLEQSQKLQAIGQLAGGIAHDFNNILTAIIGFCDLLLIQHPATDPSFRDIMQIKQNANRATNLIKQLMAFSRKQTLQPKILDINNIVADLSQMIKRLISEDIELKIYYDKNIGLVKVDLCQLEQVIVNLVVNAKSAMNSGGVLTLRTYNLQVDASTIPKGMFVPDKDQVEHGEYVVLEVIDTGHGMDKQIIKKIFDPFFSTKSESYGTGLGLSTVYGIVKQTGGYVYVHSKVGEGTKFMILLPRVYLAEGQRVEEHLLSSEPPEVGHLMLEEGQEWGNSASVLLIEDEDPVRAFTSKALSKRGFRVIDTNSGKAAIETAKSTHIDIVISDVVMPGTSGPETVAEILKIQPNVKVMFVSGYAEEIFHQHKNINLDEMFFLSKPFTLKQLLQKVSEALACNR